MKWYSCWSTQVSHLVVSCARVYENDFPYRRCRRPLVVSLTWYGIECAESAWEGSLVDLSCFYWLANSNLLDDVDHSLTHSLLIMVFGWIDARWWRLFSLKWSFALNFLYLNLLQEGDDWQTDAMVLGSSEPEHVSVKQVCLSFVLHGGG